MFKIGDKVVITNTVDDMYTENATVCFIEEDNELPILWIYVIADKEELNTEYDNRFGKYWTLRAHDSNDIFLR